MTPTNDNKAVFILPIKLVRIEHRSQIGRGRKDSFGTVKLETTDMGYWAILSGNISVYLGHERPPEMVSNSTAEIRLTLELKSIKPSKGSTP